MRYLDSRQETRLGSLEPRQDADRHEHAVGARRGSGTDAELLDELDEAFRQGVRLLRRQLDEPVAHERARPPGGADVSRDQPPSLAVAADGSVLACDTGNGRIRRIDPVSGVITAFAEVGTPRGIDIAVDGSIYVVDATARRVVHLSPTGSRLGFVGPAFGDPYDVEVGTDGDVYVLDTGVAGRLSRLAPDGTVTTVSRR